MPPYSTTIICDRCGKTHTAWAWTREMATTIALQEATEKGWNLSPDRLLSNVDLCPDHGRSRSL